MLLWNISFPQDFASPYDTFVSLERSTLWGDQLEKYVSIGQPSPRGRKCLGAKKKFPISPGWPSLSPRHVAGLVAHELDFSTHLPLRLMLTYPAQVHILSSSVAFLLALLSCTYIYLLVWSLEHSKRAQP